MDSHPTGKCPLKVYIVAASDTLMDFASDFIRNLTAVEADIIPVTTHELENVIRRVVPGQPQLVVLAVPADTLSVNGVDAASIAMDSPIPLMVLREPADDARDQPTVRRIVVPLDGSSRAAEALPLAAHMAHGGRLPMHLVTVIDPSRVIPPAFAYDPDSWLLINELRETAHWALKQAESPLIRKGIEVNAELLSGPINATLQSIIQPDDMVVMTSHGTGRARAKIGSVAERVLKSVPGPVILHRSPEPGDVVVGGYEACSWVEPLSRQSGIAGT